jgi:(5-formylfuran-3-yl)methyl phosphate synthase
MAAMASALRLLVSVVHADEIPAALAGGADIVDAKNPEEGALGAPPTALLQALRAAVTPPTLRSVALGDAPHLPGTLALAAAGAVAGGADFVKLGLRGSDRSETAFALLSAVVGAAAGVDPRARVVAVAYADASRAGGLPPGALPRVAAAAGAHGVMLDTFVKDGTSTFAVLGLSAVERFVSESRALGLRTALAGALALQDLDAACRLDLDVVGVRGAACVGGRSGRIEAGRVRALRERLDARRGASLSALGR